MLEFMTYSYPSDVKYALMEIEYYTYCGVEFWFFKFDQSALGIKKEPVFYA
jgi:hypothetical protein